jgi:transcriptional regulator with XRE-family HTH domain
MNKQDLKIRSVESIAARLAATRKIFLLSQIEFAKKAEIPQNTYNQYEKAKGRPSLDFAIQLCDTYGITLDWIYFGDMSNLRFDMADQIYENLRASGQADLAIPRPRTWARLKPEIIEDIK